MPLQNVTWAIPGQENGEGYTDTLAADWRAFHAAGWSWREIGKVVGRSGAYALRVARGDLAPAPEIVARWEAFRRGEALRLVEVPVCRTCGGVHALGDCAGKRGPLVILGEGERVTRRRPPRRWRDLGVRALAAALAERQVVEWWNGG